MASRFAAILFAFAIFSAHSLAQDLHTRSNRALKAYNDGKTAYDFFNYNDAEKFLIDAIERDTGFIEASLLLAELYKDTRQYEKSEYEYCRVLRIDSLFFIPAIFSIAEVQFFEGKYKNSLENFYKYLRQKATQPALQKRSDRYIEDCLFALEKIKNPVPFHPVSLGDSINTAFDEYWPAITVDDALLMFTRQVGTSERGIGASSSQEDFYFSERRDSVWSRARSIGEPLNTRMNEGAQTLAAGGQYMYFTACNRPDSKGGCDIYYSIRGSKGWVQGININSPVNSPYWDSQPSVSADGLRLFFVSNRPGGQGGMDIWYSNLKSDGGWTDPENLGPEINTAGDEMSPFIHFDGKTLYFASNGRPCMGGFDIYMSKTDGLGNWSEPENLGYPINTQSDEMGMIINSSGEIAYFSSAVNPKNGKDLFYFELPEELRPEPVSYFEGSVFDRVTGKKLKSTYELINLSTKETAMKSFTDDGGNFLVCLPTGQNYGLNVTRDNYLFFSENFMIEGDHPVSEPYRKQIGLSPIRKGEKMALYNVFFETNSWELKEESVIELTRLFELLAANNKVTVEIGGHTDSAGTEEHNLYLSEQRA
ncbi:MAG: flagellar motor protein MotB, partial [Bacteroidia bacterium]